MNKQVNKTKTKKEFDTIQYFRSVKNRIAAETAEMSFKDLKKYFGKRKLKTSQKATT